MSAQGGIAATSGKQINANSKSLAKAHDTAFPVDTSPVLLHLMHRFDGTPIPVSFRKIVSWIRMGERATHYIHTYPAKLLPQIAHFFLAASCLSKPGEQVLDPFGGTGTVALEAILSKRIALYADSNPLARLIAQTKTSSYNIRTLKSAFTRIEMRYRLSRSRTAPNVININYWYDTAIIRQLTRLKHAIDQEKNVHTRAFFAISLSAVARKVSRADPRFSVPVRKKKWKKSGNAPIQTAWDCFEEQFNSNLNRIRARNRFGDDLSKAHCVGVDARTLVDPTDQSKKLADSSVSLIITSPPYAGAQKYIRASSLSLGWLGIAGENSLRPLEKQNIGREHLTLDEQAKMPTSGLAHADAFISEIARKNKSRAAILAAYLSEMRTALKEMTRTLKIGGYLVLVIGDNQVCGQTFSSSEYLAAILVELGLTKRLILTDQIMSRGLTTKRHKTAGVIKSETVLLFEKEQKA